MEWDVSLSKVEYPTAIRYNDHVNNEYSNWPVRYEKWSATIAIRCNENMVFESENLVKCVKNTKKFCQV